MKKQGYLLLVLLMSAFVFCSCGQKRYRIKQKKQQKIPKKTARRKKQKIQKKKIRRPTKRTQSSRNRQAVSRRQGMQRSWKNLPKRLRKNL